MENEENTANALASVRAVPISASLRASAGDLLSWMKERLQRGPLHGRTRGVGGGGGGTRGRVVVPTQSPGPRCGEGLPRGLSISDTVGLSAGRFSTETIAKAARTGGPFWFRALGATAGLERTHV